MICELGENNSERACPVARKGGSGRKAAPHFVNLSAICIADGFVSTFQGTCRGYLASQAETG